MTDRHVTSPAEAVALLAPLAGRARESAAIIYLDARGALLAMRHIPGCDGNRIALPVRTVVADALATGAAAVVLAHNHPSGDASPSAADAALTRRLSRALATIDVTLADHLVVTGAHCASLLRP